MNSPVPASGDPGELADGSAEQRAADALSAARPTRIRSHRLADLVPADSLTGPTAVSVTGISLSSARVRPGDLYVALQGARAHGAQFAPQAVTAGAVAVATDATGAELAAGLGVPVAVLPDPRRELGALAARVYDDPATELTLIGVTGTQGKTTTTRLLEAGLLVHGTQAGVIGTVGTRINGFPVPTALTTPEAPDLHGLFARMVDESVAVCAMEVSSHALVLGRVDGVVFDVATFLNLGRDHLDFHSDVEDYYRAKAAMFTTERARRAVINVADAYGRRLVAETELPVVTFSAAPHSETSSEAIADWTVSDVVAGPEGSTFVVHGPSGSFPARCPIPGDYNVSNTLAAIVSAAVAGLDPQQVAAGIGGSGGVPGRLETVDAGQPFAVAVDYAHKPDAVEAALTTLRPVTAGRLIIVLGAGGDRDPGKRPLMGEIAARLSDILIVTDDNPRSEDPAAIRAEVLAGVPAGANADTVEIGERRGAIRHALTQARAGDTVLIAGKGHETGQEIAGTVHPFDDREVARAELHTLGFTK